MGWMQAAGGLLQLKDQAGGRPPMGQMVLGGIQTVVGLNGLRKLNKQKYPGFSQDVTGLQENVDMWTQRSQQGIPQSYIDQATNQQSSQLASAYRQIQDTSGGQLSNSFGRIAAMNRVNFAMQLAQLNDQARRQAMTQLAQSRGVLNTTLLGQSNLQTNQETQRRIMLEQAYGGALKAGTANIQQAVDYGGQSYKGPGVGQTQPGAPQQVGGPNVYAPQQTQFTVPEYNVYQPTEAVAPNPGGGTEIQTLPVPKYNNSIMWGNG